MTGTPPRERTLLATMSGLVSASRVYRTADAIEAGETEGTDVTRRRVLLDEILLVTLHRERGTAFVITTLALFLGFSAMSALIATADRNAGLVVLGLTALPALAALAWRLVFGRDVVTVYGKRTRLSLRLSTLRRRGGDVFRSHRRENGKCTHNAE